MPLIASSSNAAPASRRKPSRASILKGLSEGTPFARRRAALDLFDVPEAREALLERYQVEENSGVRPAILQALLTVADDSVVDMLIDGLRSDDAERRNEAVTTLQQLAGPMNARMGQLLNDPDPDVRILALDVLRLLPSQDAPRWLAELLDHETHENVVGNAIDRLAEFGGPEHLDVLCDVQDRFSSVPYICFAADIVIHRIETQSTAPVGAEASP